MGNEKEYSQVRAILFWMLCCSLDVESSFHLGVDLRVLFSFESKMSSRTDRISFEKRI